MTKKITLLILATISAFSLSFDANSQQRGQRGQEQQEEIPPQIKPKRLEVLNKIANDSLKREFPFTDINELDSFRENILLEKKIEDTPLIGDIKQVYRTIDLSFEPRQEFETIDLVYGYSTTLVFLDKKGNPWDIADYNPGSANIFTIKPRSNHMLTIVPKKYAGKTNLTIMFKDAKMPASINLKINDKKSDYITQINVD